ncbi:ExeA family protein [Rubrivivax albus]|uniref:AAA family ATPase n=1 Tax=Rubrivivax albus TaxID=2499835 RepID=A0A437JXH1_9BURK|nr:ExeA family protein [Rubrivivax albus]RVT52340.1 AAA family ATPase [Rubrivivax albus]
MYNALFGLTQDPFSIAPDPRFLYMSERHREALAHLLYGAQGGGGLVLLTGAVGAGKTTVCRCFVEQLPKSVDLAYVFNPALSVPELLATISDDFGLQVPAQASVKAHVDALNDFLLTRHAQGRSCVLVIDEAQSLAPAVLEQLRLLTNLETDTRKLLQIVLIGQPELRDRLAEPAMEQVAQRVIARYHLEPLAEAETPVYVRHRMAVAGLNGALPFDDDALRRIHRLTRGVPRRINLLCDRALLGAYARQRNTVSAAMVEQAAREVFGDPGATRHDRPAGRWPLAAAGLAVGLGVAAVGGWWLLGQRPGDAGEPAAWAAADAPAVAGPGASVPGPSVPAMTPGTAPAPMLDAAALVARTGWADRNAAWQALAGLWRPGAEGPTELPAGADVCGRLAPAGIACHEGSGTLSLLRQLDRPMWLALQLGAAAPSPVVLTGLGEREADLLLPDGRVRVSLATLTARWTGDFGTLWRLPPGLAAGARLDDGSAAAVWVLDRLRDEQQGALPADASATLRIQAFQRSQGLAVDGLAGPLTLMQLNRAAAVDEPRLSNPPMPGGPQEDTR